MMWTTRILADIPIKSCPHGIVDNIGFIHIEFSNVFPSTASARFHASFPVVFLRFSQGVSGLFSMGRPSCTAAVHVSRETPVRSFAHNAYSPRWSPRGYLRSPPFLCLRSDRRRFAHAFPAPPAARVGRGCPAAPASPVPTI